MFDEVPVERLRLVSDLPHGLQQRNPLENERDGQDDVPDDEVAGRLRAEQLLDTVRDRHRGTGDKQP